MTIDTIPANDRREIFTAVGGQTVFPFDFPIYAETDLLVTRRRGIVEAPLVYGSDYTVSGAGEQAGGTITLAAGALANDRITIESAMPVARTSKFTDGGNLPAASLNGDNNRAVIWIQQLLATVARSLKLPGSDAAVAVELPTSALRANKLLGFDAAGAVATYAFPGAGATLTGNATLATVTASGALTARTLAERFGETANVRDFGAVGDGVANDTAAFQAALATQKTVTVPQGIYLITAKLTLQHAGQRVLGVGADAVIKPSGNFDVFEITGGVAGCAIDGLHIDGALHSGGYVIAVRNADRTWITRITGDSPFNFAYVQRANMTCFRDIWINAVRGGFMVHLFGSPALRSDVIALENVTISASGAVPQGSRAIGLLVDGNVHTVTWNGLRFVTPSYGLVTRNTAGGSFPNQTPAFLQGDDLEVDYPTFQCVFLEFAWSVNMVNAYLCNSVFNEAVYIGPTCVHGTMTSAFVQGNARGGINIFGDDWNFTNCLVAFNCVLPADQGLYDGFFVGNGASRIKMTGCHSGNRENVGATQRWGLYVAPGAANVFWSGGFLGGNMQGPWRDDSGGGNDNFEVTANGSLLSVVDNLLMGTAAGFGATGTVTISGGTVTAPTVLTGGRHYEVAPSVFVFDPSGTGSGAVVTATVANGVVTGLSGGGGSGYSANTRLYFRPQNTLPTVRPYTTAADANMRINAKGNGSFEAANDQGRLVVASNVAGTVSAPLLLAAAGGGAVTMSASSSSADVDVGIAAKGNGRIVLTGQTAGSAGAVAGYLVVVVGGTPYKIALNS